jgi:hypothetical protein
MLTLVNSVADPDPYVFGPTESGSGSIRQRYGSGSGSVYHQAKIVRKALIPTVQFCDFFMFFLSLKNNVNVPSKSNKQKKLASVRSMTKIAGSGSGSISHRHGSADPDPYQNVNTDQQHCLKK